MAKAMICEFFINKYFIIQMLRQNNPEYNHVDRAIFARPITCKIASEFAKKNAQDSEVVIKTYKDRCKYFFTICF
ncbi:hypothetical protein HYD_6210 [Candidatus Hydrogenosomobacter endosymbioticus]|uniref:Uncharacterized protein n=1 Tax=Candidatus Hydrogenosomobacter endosymbioticus TaxID=2558174 RepID=A0ABN6L3N6_9PROT|nr:hypothetical protein HYD_6210 [Candidatus Hydrogenosomobacter endosymbioticus]